MTETLVSGIVVALVGAIAGATVSEVRGLIDYRRSTLRTLKFSRARTLDRLLKIRTAAESGHSDTVDHELWLLGPELDRYLSALSALRDPGELSGEWETYEQVQTMVSTHNLTKLDATIDRLRPRMV
jgi:hypothetical protein